jgi:hypothetical protein
MGSIPTLGIGGFDFRPRNIPTADPNSLGGLVPPPLPEPIDSARDRLGKKLMGEFLYDMLLSPPAMRSHATGAGMVGGSAVMPGLGTFAGGLLGNLGMQGAQRVAPEMFGEPPIESGGETALMDTGASLAGGAIGGGAVRAGRLAGKGAKWAGLGLAALATDKGKKRLAARVFDMMGDAPFERQVRYPGSSTGFSSTEDYFVKDLVKRGMPISAAQMQMTPTGLAIMAQNRTGKEFLRDQSQYVENMGKELVKALAPNPGKAVNPYQSMDEIARWLQKSIRWNRGSFTPKADLKGALTELPKFEDLQKQIGPDRARQVLLMDWMDEAYDGSLGKHNPAKLAKYMEKRKSMFDSVAKAVEVDTGGAVKASGLKADWNRFLAAGSIAARGNDIGGRALEMEATNAGTALLAALPTIGLMNYPVARSLGVASKIGFIGPRMAKAMTDRDVIQEMIKLQTARANSAAHQSAFRSFLKVAAKKGIPLSARDASGTWMDLQYNPTQGSFVPSAPTNESIEQEMSNPWDLKEEANPLMNEAQKAQQSANPWL